MCVGVYVLVCKMCECLSVETDDFEWVLGTVTLRICLPALNLYACVYKFACICECSNKLVTYKLWTYKFKATWYIHRYICVCTLCLVWFLCLMAYQPSWVIVPVSVIANETHKILWDFEIQGVSIYTGPLWLLITLLLIMCSFLF